MTPIRMVELLREQIPRLREMQPPLFALGFAHAIDQILAIAQARDRPGVLRLAELVNLPQGWDSYGAEAIAFSVHQEALRFYDMIADHGLPEPSIVPTTDGGIEFVWFASDNVEISAKVGP